MGSMGLGAEGVKWNYWRAQLLESATAESATAESATAESATAESATAGGRNYGRGLRRRRAFASRGRRRRRLSGCRLASDRSTFTISETIIFTLTAARFESHPCCAGVTKPVSNASIMWWRVSQPDRCATRSDCNRCLAVPAPMLSAMFALTELAALHSCSISPDGSGSLFRRAISTHLLASARAESQTRNPWMSSIPTSPKGRHSKIASVIRPHQMRSNDSEMLG